MRFWPLRLWNCWRRWDFFVMWCRCHPDVYVTSLTCLLVVSLQMIQDSNDSISQMKNIESLVCLNAKVDFECRVSVTHMRSLGEKNVCHLNDGIFVLVCRRCRWSASLAGWYERGRRLNWETSLWRKTREMFTCTFSMTTSWFPWEKSMFAYSFKR